MAPLFSIILAIYNVESYLDRCIQSILSQNFSDYEMILVDDGSTDGSAQICDRYADRYDNIRVVHKENGGLSSARNAGMDIAEGDYIWWIDSDDWADKQSLSVLYEAVKVDRPDIVKFNHIRVTDREMLVVSSAVPGKYIQGNQIELLLKQALIGSSKYILSAWSHLYKREFLQKEGLRFVSEREVGSEDYLFNLEALLKTSQITVLNDMLYYYELRSGSLSQKYKENASQKYTTLYQQLKSFFDLAGVLGVYERAINRFYAWHLIHGICISNEYILSEKHSKAEARKNMQMLLSLPELQQAIRRIDATGLSWKQKTHLHAMKYRVELLFYWLYVIKPKYIIR